MVSDAAISYREMGMVAADNVCATCAGALMVYAQPGAGPGIRCKVSEDHEGWTMSEQATAALSTVNDAQSLDVASRQSMVVGASASDIVLMGRYVQQFELLPIQAAAFLLHSKALGLDPFLGEIAPLPYRDNEKGGKSVQPFITAKGWAKLANRHEPHEFAGNPKLERLSDPEMKELGMFDAVCAYRATGTKMSWLKIKHTTEVVASIRDNEIKGKSSQLPIVADPHQHCRTRVTRRWYEQNFPAAAVAIDEAEATVSEDVIRVIEGEFKVITEHAESLATETGGHDLENWEEFCPRHHVEWTQDHEIYGKSHRAPQGFCNARTVVNEIAKGRIEKASTELNMSRSDANEMCKSMFEGRTFSKLSNEEKHTFVKYVENLLEQRNTAESEGDLDDENGAEGQIPVSTENPIDMPVPETATDLNIVFEKVGWSKADVMQLTGMEHVGEWLENHEGKTVKDLWLEMIENNTAQEASENEEPAT